MLLINDLSFSRNNIKIFENLNLSLGNNQIIQIKGKNGSGKTTFKKVVLPDPFLPFIWIIPLLFSERFKFSKILVSFLEKDKLLIRSIFTD